MIIGCLHSRPSRARLTTLLRWAAKLVFFCATVVGLWPSLAAASPVTLRCVQSDPPAGGLDPIRATIRLDIDRKTALLQLYAGTSPLAPNAGWVTQADDQNIYFTVPKPGIGTGAKDFYGALDRYTGELQARVDTMPVSFQCELLLKKF